MSNRKVKKRTWQVNAAVHGGKWLGEVEAATRKEAEELAQALVDENGWVNLCHQCSAECENGEIGDVDVSADDDIQPTSSRELLEIAASDLLEACKNFVESFSAWRNCDIPEKNDCGMGMAWVKARDAIAKATGVRQ